MAVTIKDIAKMAGVSITTVSRILNNKEGFISEATREKVLKIVKEQGYTPNSFARSLVTNQSRMLGLILPDIVNPYFPELYRACDDQAQEKGYTLLLCNSDDESEKVKGYMEFLARRGVDGILLASSGVSPKLEQIERLGVPIVTIDQYLEECSWHVGDIGNDNTYGVYLAVSHLIGRGHEKIGFLCGKEGTFTSKCRYQGYQQAMQEHGLAVQPELICFGEYQHRFGYQKTRELVRQGQSFTALCCMSDTVALGAMAALREEGIRVPKDCAVMGYDNTYISDLIEKPLSTINRFTTDMAKQGVQVLVDYIEGKNKEYVEKILKPTLVVRKTT